MQQIIRNTRPDASGTYAYTIADPSAVTSGDLEALPYHYLCSLSDITRRATPHLCIDRWSAEIGPVSLL